MPSATSIFKYRSFCKTSLELFINRELWFAKPDSLNDPFECQMLLPEVLESIWRHYPIPKAQQLEIENFLAEFVNGVGICSLSRTRKNQLMWAHYADEHKGFCIGFSEDRLRATSKSFHSQVIEYQNELPYKGVIDRIKRAKKSKNVPQQYQNSAYSIASDIMSSVIGMGESLILTVFSGFALQGIPHSNKFRLAL